MMSHTQPELCCFEEWQRTIAKRPLSWYFKHFLVSLIVGIHIYYFQNFKTLNWNWRNVLLVHTSIILLFIMSLVFCSCCSCCLVQKKISKSKFPKSILKMLLVIRKGHKNCRQYLGHLTSSKGKTGMILCLLTFPLATASLTCASFKL